jgi:hypothetical protein
MECRALAESSLIFSSRGKRGGGEGVERAGGGGGEGEEGSVHCVGRGGHGN